MLSPRAPQCSVKDGYRRLREADQYAVLSSTYSFGSGMRSGLLMGTVPRQPGEEQAEAQL